MIRPTTPADIAVIIDMVRDLSEEDGTHARSDVTVTEDDLRQAMFGDHPDLTVIIAEVEQAAAGFAAWFPTYTTWVGRRSMCLADLYITPEHRRQGIARALMRTLAEVCVRDGYHRIEWRMAAVNDDATAFYTAIGARIPDRVMWSLSSDRARALTR